jgi:hypothetical protein
LFLDNSQTAISISLNLIIFLEKLLLSCPFLRNSNREACEVKLILTDQAFYEISENGNGYFQKIPFAELQSLEIKTG